MYSANPAHRVLVVTMAVTLIGALPEFSARARQDEAVPKDEKQAELRQAIQQAYEASQSAKSTGEFTQVVHLCEKTLTLPVSADQKDYLNQLLSWALVARARTYPEVEKQETAGETTPEQPELKAGPDSPVQLAIEDCTAAIAADPGNWKAYVHRAQRQVQWGDFQAAIEDLGAAIRRQPEDARLWFNRAELLYAQQQYEVAVADYSQVLRIDATDIQAITGRAHAYARLGKLALALADYDQVIERTQHSAEAYLNRADLHLRMRNFKQAGEDYRDALTRDQTLAQAYRGVAWMYATSGQDQYFNPTVADRSVKRAIQLDGRETVENLVVLAAAQAAGGEYAMARDTLKRVRAELKPESAEQAAEAERNEGEPVSVRTDGGVSQGVSSDTLEKLEFLESSKWYQSGTGQSGS